MASLTLSKVSAVGLLLILVVAFLFGVLAPLKQEISEKKDQIDRLRHQKGRFEQALSQAGVIHDNTAHAVTSEVWSGKSKAIIAAKLQELVQHQASVNEVAIGSILPINGQSIEGYESIGLRVECNGEIGGVRDLLRFLENHHPYIFLSSVELRPKPAYGYKNPKEILPLSMRLDLYIAVELGEEKNA